VGRGRVEVRSWRRSETEGSCTGCRPSPIWSRLPDSLNKVMNNRATQEKEKEKEEEEHWIGIIQ
jgi:hypothetical protein